MNECLPAPAVGLPVLRIEQKGGIERLNCIIIPPDMGKCKALCHE